MKLKLETVILPAHWASALINSDCTGLEDEEEAELDAWVADNPHLGQALDVGEPYLGWYEGKIAEVAEYKFPALPRHK